MVLLISITSGVFSCERGVVPALVGIAAMTIITSWWYSRKVKIQPPAMTASQTKEEAAALLKLGFAFMASGILMMGAAYAVRIMVIRMVDLEAAGYYQAAWTLGGLYVGFILQAMGADFYPRLTAVAEDNAMCNRLVNEQTQISLLLAGPGVIATLTFASVVIALFYSAKFGPAVEVLAVDLSGHDPPGNHLADRLYYRGQGAQKIFFWAELAWAVVNVGFSWICVSSFAFDRCRYCIFCIVRLSLASDLSDRSATQRFSLVSREQ